MPSLTESLEKRIAQLKASIETQQQQLAAYERVLALEQGTAAPISPPEGDNTAGAPARTQVPSTTPRLTDSGPAFTGNKTELVAALVQACGERGATSQEIN